MSPVEPPDSVLKPSGVRKLRRVDALEAQSQIPENHHGGDVFERPTYLHRVEQAAKPSPPAPVSSRSVAPPIVPEPLPFPVAKAPENPPAPPIDVVAAPVVSEFVAPIPEPALPETHWEKDEEEPLASDLRANEWSRAAEAELAALQAEREREAREAQLEREQQQREAIRREQEAARLQREKEERLAREKAEEERRHREAEALLREQQQAQELAQKQAEAAEARRRELLAAYQQVEEPEADVHEVFGKAGELFVKAANQYQERKSLGHNFDSPPLSFDLPEPEPASLISNLPPHQPEPEPPSTAPLDPPRFGTTPIEEESIQDEIAPPPDELAPGMVFNRIVPPPARDLSPRPVPTGAPPIFTPGPPIEEPAAPTLRVVTRPVVSEPAKLVEPTVIPRPSLPPVDPEKILDEAYFENQKAIRTRMIKVLEEEKKLRKEQIALQREDQKLKREELKLIKKQQRLRDEELRASRKEEFNLGAWLAGAGMADLRDCSPSERAKVCATGYTVLVPTIFSLLSASYATSTLTTNPYVIGLVAVAWAVIILLVDRAIIATYSPNMSFLGKAGTIVIRFVVASLMGITVSHPLTLLIFKDTINARIEEERTVEIATKREQFATGKKSVEQKLAAAQTELQKQQKLFQDSLDAKVEPTVAVADVVAAAGSLTDAEQSLLSQRIETAAKPFQAELDDLQARVKAGEARRDVLQKETAEWRAQYEAELGGTRSGRSGPGPRSEAIAKMELKPRQDELATLQVDLTASRARLGELRKSISESSERLRKQMEDVARTRAEKAKAENDRLAAMQNEIKEKKLTVMLSEGDGIRKGIQRAIDSAQAETERIQRELDDLTTQELKVMNDLRTNPRRDMLSQSMALHHLFEHPELGGEVAWIAYVVLAALFLAIDTMPILVKFTAKKGEYDQRRELAYNMADIPAELRKPDAQGAEDLRRRALDLSLQEQRVRVQALHKQALENEGKALEEQAKVHQKEQAAILARAERDAALKLKNLELEEKERAREQKVADEKRKLAQAERQAKLEQLELAVKEAEANEALAKAHLSELNLKVVKNDPQGLLKHQLHKEQVKRGEERFAQRQAGDQPGTDPAEDLPGEPQPSADSAGAPGA